MKHLTRCSVLSTAVVSLLLVGVDSAAPSPSLTEHPATLDVSVSPENAGPGERVDVVLRIVPKDGVKINRYPKIRFEVGTLEGLLAGGEVTLGNETPPPPDKMDTNYFDRVDPLTLTLALDGAAGKGRHKIDGQVTYYYCVAKSGFCAPKKDRVRFELEVR